MPPAALESTPAGPVGSQSPPQANPREADEPARLLAVWTLLLWCLCLSIGLCGFVLPYSRPHPPAPPEVPILAQSLPVDLSAEPTPPPPEPPPPDPQLPPPPPEDFLPPPLIRPVVVARPTPAIAFPVPIETPASIVEHNQNPPPQPVVTNSPQPLVFGQGEGRQPAPDYPRQAERLGQQGAVVVRLKVGPDGRVESAEDVVPSPWPLLNAAALRVVRERWRFSAGPPRLYEVTIRFQIEK